MKKLTRRRILKTLGAAAVTPFSAPFLNLAHAQGATIPIGVALPMTGNAGAYGPDMAEAAKRTVKKINDAGGILGGRKLELFIEDSESSASVAANLSQKFINVQKCQALVGYWGTPEGMSSRPIAMQNKTVLMVSSAANAITEGDTQGYIWRFQMKATDWGVVIGRAVQRLGFKSIGIMGLQNAFVLPIMKTVEDQMKSAGRTVTDSLIYNPEQPSYRAEVERIFGKKPDAVCCFGLLAGFRLDHERGLSRRLRQQDHRAFDHGRCRGKIRRGRRAAGSRRHTTFSADARYSGARIQKVSAADGRALPTACICFRRIRMTRLRLSRWQWKRLKARGGRLVKANHSGLQRPRAKRGRRCRCPETDSRRQADQFQRSRIDV
jgi:hypothetical protein